MVENINAAVLNAGKPEDFRRLSGAVDSNNLTVTGKIVIRGVWNLETDGA